MRICIINQHFDIGGVETFLINLTDGLRSRGIGVTLLLIERRVNKGLLDRIQDKIENIFYLDAWDEFAVRAGQFDAALVTNQYTLMTAAYMLKTGRLNAKRMLAGVYQTKMFCLDRGWWDIQNRIAGRVFSRIPSGNVIFGNEACKNEHLARHRGIHADAAVIALIVDTARFNKVSRQPIDRFRIISVGRLESFKTYNLSMISVVRDLKEEGFPVHWHVYGSGPLMPQMQQCILDFGVTKNVTLHGSISYEEMESCFSTAGCFVGSGLSLLEAAAAAVPALGAIEYSVSADSFGFINELPGISFFEPGLPYTRVSLKDKILSLINFDESSYDSLAIACKEKVNRFSKFEVARDYDALIRASIYECPQIGWMEYFLYKTSNLLSYHVKRMRFFTSLFFR